MRRMLLILAAAAMMVAILGVSAGPALADDRDRGDHFRGVHDDDFLGREDFLGAIHDDDDDDEDDWACVPWDADDLGTAAIFFVDSPADCPAGYRTQLILGDDDEDDDDLHFVDHHHGFHPSFDDHHGFRNRFVD